jgi:hypothetical protein
MIQPLQVGVRPAPGQFTEFVISAAAQYYGIAVYKFLIQLLRAQRFVELHKGFELRDGGDDLLILR